MLKLFSCWNVFVIPPPEYCLTVTANKRGISGRLLHHRQSNKCGDKECVPTCYRFDLCNAKVENSSCVCDALLEILALNFDAELDARGN